MLNNQKVKLLYIIFLIVALLKMVNAAEILDRGIYLPLSDTPFGVRATNAALDTLMPREMPCLDSKSKRPTLNRYGFETTLSDRFSEDWVKKALFYAELGLPSVEIGAAYGQTATLPALAAGATIVANDICPEHLLLLREQVPVDRRSRLILNTEPFPDISFEAGSVGSFLLRSVMHFLAPPEMERGITNIYRWLVPGGEVTISIMSPFHYILKDFLSEYEKRWSTGNLWPGEINDMRTYNPGEADAIPEYLHVMDGRPLIRILEAVGFKIEKEGFFGFPHSRAKDPEGKAYFGIRAVKPKSVKTE